MSNERKITAWSGPLGLVVGLILGALAINFFIGAISSERLSLLFLSLPLLLLGFAQFASPHTSVLNQYVWGGSSFKASAGGAVRVTSTFSFLWGYTAYLQFLYSPEGQRIDVSLLQSTILKASIASWIRPVRSSVRPSSRCASGR